MVGQRCQAKINAVLRAYMLAILSWKVMSGKTRTGGGI